jgi:hypothetical protein
VVSDLPLKGKKRERRPTLLISHPTLEKKAKKRGKKTNRQPKHNTSKKERERERERKRVFFKRKERHFSSFLSLLSLSSPEGGAS